MIAPIADPTTAISFEQEVQSTASVVHENVLKIVDHGTFTLKAQQALFVVSEYCPDGDYRQRQLANRGQPPDVALVASDFRQILMGLGALHTRIIHRDLKPANVLVSGSLLKIADFGLARFVDAATRTHTFKGGGTPYYMAPEVWLMQRATAATDLYAVGVMLYEAFTGELPFVAADVNSLRDLHLYTPAPRTKARNAGVPDIVDGLIKKLLAKEPQARYQSANEVLEVFSSIATAPAASPLADVVARMRNQHDQAEVKRLQERRTQDAERDTQARNQYMERELLTLLDELVAEINAHLAETKIENTSSTNSRKYRFGSRTLVIRFFREGEIYRDPKFPGRMAILRTHHAAHGGVIEIQENGEDREGWNVVLVRHPDSLYGEWRLVETRVSGLSRMRVQYEPLATEAALLADNLACHWSPAMHTFNLTDKTLEREDLIRIFDIFVP